MIWSGKKTLLITIYPDLQLLIFCAGPLRQEAVRLAYLVICVLLQQLLSRLAISCLSAPTLKGGADKYLK